MLLSDHIGIIFDGVAGISGLYEVSNAAQHLEGRVRRCTSTIAFHIFD